MSLFQGMKVSRVDQEGGEGGQKSLFSFITSTAAAPPVDQIQVDKSSITETSTTASSVTSSSKSVSANSQVSSPPYTLPSGLSASGATSGYSSESSSTASSPRAVTKPASTGVTLPASTGITFPVSTGDASPSDASVMKLAVPGTKITRKKRHGSLIRPGYARQDISTDRMKTDPDPDNSPVLESTLREEPEEMNVLDKSVSVNRVSPEKTSSPKLSTQERADTLRPDKRTSSEIPRDCHPAKLDRANILPPLNSETQTEENRNQEKSSSSNPFESLTLDVAGSEQLGETTAVSELESLSLDLSFDLDFDLDLDVTMPCRTGPDNLQCNSDIETGLLDGLELDLLASKADEDTVNTGADREESHSVQNTTTVKSSFRFLQSADVAKSAEDNDDIELEIKSCTSTEKTESNHQPVGTLEVVKTENTAVDDLPEETDTRKHDDNLDLDRGDAADNTLVTSEVAARKDENLVTTDSRMEDSQTSRLEEVRERFSCLQQQHQTLLQTHIKQCCRQVKKRQELSRVKAEQDLAVKNEDYEKAEAFNRRLQSLKADLQVMTFDLPSSESSTASLLEEMRHVMEEEVAMVTEEAERYTAMKTKEELCLKELQMTKQVELNREKQKLTTLQDQLAMAASHLSLDREHLQKSKAQLSSQVEERTAEFHTAREQLVEKRQDIQEEISALEEQLRVLRQQEEAISAEIQLQEDSISRVEQQFSAERVQLEEERRTIDRKQGELEAQAREAVQEEQTLRDREVELQTEEKRLQDSLQSIQERVSLMLGQAQELSTRAEGMTALPVYTRTINTDDQQLTRLNEQQRERQREVQELTTQVLRYQTRVTDLNKQLGETAAQLPVLQEAKQLAVAGYNFAEAKRIADEIKTLEDKRVAKEKELVRAKEDVEQRTQDLETSKKVFKEVQEELKQKDEENDVARKDEAYQLYQELQLQLERCANDVIRSVLQADMTTCQLWIQDICEKHHLPLPQELQSLDLHGILGDDDGMVIMDTSCVGDRGMLKAASSENEEAPTGAPGVSCAAEDHMQACEAAGGSCQAEDYVQACEAFSMRLLELEDQLQEAVGLEDYEAAQTLHEEIQTLKHQLQNMLVCLQQHDL